MSVRELKNFVNGEYVSAKSGETSDVINPATGETYATAPVSSAADVASAYQAAEKAFEEWSQFTPGERQTQVVFQRYTFYMHRIHRWFEFQEAVFPA